MRLTTSCVFMKRTCGHGKVGLVLAHDIDRMIPQSNLQQRFKAIIGDGVVEPVPNDSPTNDFYTNGSKILRRVRVSILSQELHIKRSSGKIWKKQ